MRWAGAQVRAKLLEGWVGLGTEHSPSSQGPRLPAPASSLGQPDFPFCSSVSPDRMDHGRVRSVSQIATLSSVTQEGHRLFLWVCASCLRPGLVGTATVVHTHVTQSLFLTWAKAGRAADPRLTPAAGSCLGSAWGCDIVPLSSCRPYWALR